MNIQIERIDITEQLRSPPPDPNWTPLVLLKRQLPDGPNRRVPYVAAGATATDRWYIFDHKVGVAADRDWSVDKSSPQVRIPLYSYLIKDEPELLVQVGAQVAAFALATLREDGHRIERLVVLIGNVFTRPDRKPGYQCWLGFAAQAIPAK